MRIVYADPLFQLRAMVDKVNADKEAFGNAMAAEIVVSKDEMVSIARHRDAVKTFPDFFSSIVARKVEIEHEMIKLQEKVNRVARLVERQELFNQISDLEMEAHELGQKTPSNLVLDGVTIRVSLRG